MFSLLRASINIHYNASLSERINSFHLQLPENRFREGPEHFPLTSQSALAARPQ